LLTKGIDLIISDWNIDNKFFIKSTILRSYLKVNKNRLRNIFLKTVKDLRFWEEFEKMFNVGLIDICSCDVFKKFDVFESSFLSTFFLNLYLSELDFYIFQLSFFYNSRINIIGFRNILSKYSKELKYTFSYLLPVKFYNFSIDFNNLKELECFKFGTFFNLFPIFLTKNFSRAFFYIRYLHYFLLLVNGSKYFSIYLKDKILTFIRSNLRLELKEVLVMSSFKNSLFFLGFNLKFLNFSFIFNRKFMNKYSRKIDSKLINYKLKLNKLYFKRIKFELLLNVNLLVSKSFNISYIKNQKFWIALFQLESLRCTQFGKLMFFKNNLNLFSSDIISFIKYNNDNYNYRYSFSLYSKKLFSTFKDIINDSPSFIFNSVGSLELSLDFLVDDFRKSLMFFFTDFIYQDKEFINNKNSNLLKKSFLKIYNKNNSQSIIINVPFQYLFQKLRVLGFIHSIKKRPISNVKYLTFSDIYIIKSFGCLANSFILWFKMCSNFSKVKFIVELLRQSCFLTLSRKHNKSKNWSYCVYTSDLVIVRKLSSSFSYFPSRKFISNIIFNLSRFINFYSFYEEDFFLDY
jgi:hypothetical protein